MPTQQRRPQVVEQEGPHNVKSAATAPGTTVKPGRALQQRPRTRKGTNQFNATKCQIVTLRGGALQPAAGHNTPSSPAPRRKDRSS
jgi:hypothetical protein